MARRAGSDTGLGIPLSTNTHSTSQFVFPWAWRRNHRVRADGSRAVAKAALRVGVQTLVQESVAMISPDGGTDWIDEDTPQYRSAVEGWQATAAALDRRG